MKVAVLQSNYVPWKGYFHLIKSVDKFCFYDEVQYTKNDWRNRNIIKTKNGINWLTVPIQSNATKGKISDAKIADIKWQKKHYQSIKFGYGKAPYYSQIEDLANEYLIDQKWDYLSRLNQFLIERISRLIGINTEFVNSFDYDLSQGRIERLVSLVKSLGGTKYISGPSAKIYLKNHESLFLDEGIELEYFEYPKYPRYQQLNDQFDENVSILDLIANVNIDEIPNYIWRK